MVRARVSTNMATSDVPRPRARPWRAVPTACRHPIRFFGRLYDHIEKDHILTIAAAMAYYFFLSLIPFVLFVLALITLVPVEGLEDWLLGQAAQWVPGEAYSLIESIIRGFLAQPRGGLVSIGAALALWTASSAFIAVMGGMTRAYGVDEYRSWWRVRLQAMGLTIGLSMFMVVTFVLTIFGGQLAALIGRNVGPIAEVVALVIRWSVVVVAVLVVVGAIDWACPATPHTWRWLTPGTVVFILGFALCSAAFSYYVDRFGSYDKTYGSLGAVIILLVWMYMLAAFMLLGGEVNALLERMDNEREEAAALATTTLEGSGEPAARGQVSA
jgi:membrane protein